MTVYVPTGLVSTLPETVTVVVPWYASSAVAPASTYVPPNSTVTDDAQFNVITGGISSLYLSAVMLLTIAAPATTPRAF